MFEIIQNMLNIYTLSFFVGFLLSLFLIVSKSLFIFLMFMKKQVALGTIVIVLSESVIGISMYFFVQTYKEGVGYLALGFTVGLTLSLFTWILMKKKGA